VKRRRRLAALHFKVAALTDESATFIDEDTMTVNVTLQTKDNFYLAVVGGELTLCKDSAVKDESSVQWTVSAFPSSTTVTYTTLLNVGSNQLLALAGSFAQGNALPAVTSDVSRGLVFAIGGGGPAIGHQWPIEMANALQLAGAETYFTYADNGDGLRYVQANSGQSVLNGWMFAARS
jgi:hypothetical protein